MGASWDERTYQLIGLANLLGRLLEALLGNVDVTVAAVERLLELADVVVLEAKPLLLALGQALVFHLEALGVHLGAGAEVLLGVYKEIVGTGADKERVADFGVVEGKL